MEIRYTATPEDVGAVFRYNLRHSSRFLIVLAGIALYPITLTTIVGFVARGHVTVRDLLIGLGIGLLAVLAFPIVARVRTKRDERVLNVDAQGIQTSVGKLSGQVAWSEIASVAVTSDHIFITGKNSNAFAIPTRAFSTTEERLEFVRQVNAFRAFTRPAAAI